MPKVGNLSIYDFGKICRTCLSEGDMQPLYETCSKEVCLIEMLTSCTFVQFTENDSLPVQICLECVKEINHAYSFAKKCEDADAALRKCITEFQNKLRNKSNKSKGKVTSVGRKTDLRKARTKKPPLRDNGASSNPEISSEGEIKNERELEDKNQLIGDLNLDLIVVKREPSKPEYENTDSDLDPDNFDGNEELLKENPDKNGGSKSLEVKAESFDPDDLLGRKTEISSEIRKRNSYRLKSQPPYECKKCFEKFPNYQLLKLHREERKHPPNSYSRKTCKICSKSVGYSRMNQHMRIHTMEKPYCCEVCGTRFSISSNLRRHTLARHSSEKPYKCDKCGKGFTRLGFLKDHQRTHTGERPFVCNFCGKAFAQSSTFRTHLFIHAKRGETTGQITGKEHECPDCSRCFATKALLKAHQLIHGEKKFLCSDCGRGFVSMILLKSHSRVHTGVKPYSCSVCGKSFSHIGSLKSHNLIHTGEKPFICSVCNRAFTQRNHLKYHMRTHSGERPYVCSVCGKTFALNGNLTVHMRTHTGETPYLCPICGKGFHDSSSMKKHKKGHTAQPEIADV